MMKMDDKIERHQVIPKFTADHRMDIFFSGDLQSTLVADAEINTEQWKRLCLMFNNWSAVSICAYLSVLCRHNNDILTHFG